MPFTFSHPAIVLPFALLNKKWFSITGLVIGSLTPDFEYFIRMKIQSDHSHSLMGVFWFDLPIGILLCFLFHNIVKEQLIENLPFLLKSRFISFQLDWNTYFRSNWQVVIYSVLIGAASHNLWDSFTHQDGFFVLYFSKLSSSIFILDKEIPVYKVLQHASSIFGALTIGLTVFFLPQQTIIRNEVNFKYWAILIGIITLIVFLRFGLGLELHEYGNIIVTILSASIISLITTSLILKLFNR